MMINFWAVLVCAVISIIVGSLWYGPIFGKVYMRLYGMTDLDPAVMAQKKKEARVLYFVQFVLTLLQVFVLALFVFGPTALAGIENALWIWAGFVMTTTAGAVLWTSDSRRVVWQKFLIQAGYQLVMFVIYGAVLAVWR